jgi:hypothetical protein
MQGNEFLQNDTYQIADKNDMNPENVILMKMAVGEKNADVCRRRRTGRDERDVADRAIQRGGNGTIFPQAPLLEYFLGGSHKVLMYNN